MIKMENKSVVTTAYAVRHFIVLQEIFEAATPMRFGVIAGALRAAKRFKCIRGNFLQLPHCALGILRESLPTLTKFGQVLVVGILECFICNRCFHIKNGEQLVATNVAALRGRTFAVRLHAWDASMRFDTSRSENSKRRRNAINAKRCPDTLPSHKSIPSIEWLGFSPLHVLNTGRI